MRRMLPLGVAALTLALVAPAGAEPIGFMATSIGAVEHANAGSAAWKAARRDADVEIGDGIRTGTDSQAKIVLVDDTLFQIDEETELRIETWHVGAAATQERSIVRQTRGRLRATVGEAFGGSTRLELNIPTAAIGIKGTDFETRKRDLWECCTLSGEIVVSNSHGSASPPPGMCVYAYADKAPGDPFPNPLKPLHVNGGGPEQGIADSDFTQKIEVDVAGEGEGPGEHGPNLPNGNGGMGYDSSSGKNNEDELEPDVDVPEIELDEPESPQIPLG